MTSTSTDRLSGVSSSVAVKAPVRAATTAAITLSGLQTIDGVALASGDRVLVKNQSASAENGIYEANTSSWARAKDWDGDRDAVDGSLVYVRAGSVNAGLLYKAACATSPPSIGTTAVTFSSTLTFNSLGTIGAQLLAAETESEALGILGAGATGEDLFGAADDNTAIESLVDDATATTSPALADAMPLRTSGGAGRKATIADILALLPMRGYIDGLVLSRNATVTSLDIAAGVARDDSNADFMSLGSAITKSLNSTWAVGTGNGGLDTGAKANSTWYHVWLIKRVDTDVVDALFSTSVSSPTMPTGYTLKRRIGSIRTDSSGDITLFSQNGDEFLWSATVADVNATNPGTSAVSRTLSVPTGVKVDALWMASITNTDATRTYLYVSALDQSDEVAANGLADVGGGATGDAGVLNGTGRTRTNTSGQVRSRVAHSSANVTITMRTRGWVDQRGRNA